MRDIVRRVMHAPPELAAELERRGLLRPEEAAELAECSAKKSAARHPLASAHFVTLLAHGDAQLAAAAVLRNLLAREEVERMNRLLNFKKASPKRDDLVRIVERALKGAKDGRSR